MNKFKTYSVHQEDFYSFLDIVESIEYQENSKFYTNLVDKISKVFKTNQINFYLGDNNGGIDAQKVVSIGIDESYHKIYANHFYRLSPFVSPVPRQLTSKYAIRVKDIMPYSSWKKLEFYNDFIRPQGLFYEMMLYLQSEDSLFGVISLLRSKTEGDFRLDDVVKARFLALFLSNILGNFKLLSNMKFEIKVLDRAHDIFRQGILLLDFDLHIKYLNSTAEHLLKFIDNDVLKIPDQIMTDCMELKQLFLRNKNNSNLQKRCFIKINNQSQALRAISSVISESFNERFIQPYFIISLETETSEISRNGDESFREEYHLTERELELTRLISFGLSNDEIAKKLFISRLTVQHHIQNIFDKTNARNRTHLARMLIK